MPNCTEEFESKSIEFGRLGRRVIEGRLDGGSMTSDGGVMLRQRVYALALGWEDLNDHSALRQDVALQTAVGVEREVASAPTLCRLEKWADRATAWLLRQLLLPAFVRVLRPTTAVRVLASQPH